LHDDFAGQLTIKEAYENAELDQPPLREHRRLGRENPRRRKEGETDEGEELLESFGGSGGGGGRAAGGERATTRGGEVLVDVEEAGGGKGSVSLAFVYPSLF
jgi:hypothetical protein